MLNYTFWEFFVGTISIRECSFLMLPINFTIFYLFNQCKRGKLLNWMKRDSCFCEYVFTVYFVCVLIPPCNIQAGNNLSQKARRCCWHDEYFMSLPRRKANNVRLVISGCQVHAWFEVLIVTKMPSHIPQLLFMF